MERCPWCFGNEKMIHYHDKEWGVPEDRLFHPSVMCRCGFMT